MKIIGTKEEITKLVGALSESNYCPSRLDLAEYGSVPCAWDKCIDCWTAAIRSVSVIEENL